MITPAPDSNTEFVIKALLFRELQLQPSYSKLSPLRGLIVFLILQGVQ